MKTLDRDAVLDLEVSTWFRKFLEENRREMSFFVVGKRLVLTGDGTLLYVAHDSRVPWLPGNPLRPFVLVYRKCTVCHKVVHTQTECTTFDAIKLVQYGDGGYHNCGWFCGADPLGLISEVYGLYKDSVERVFRAYYGMAPEQMEIGYAFTPRGPAQLPDADVASFEWIHPALEVEA